MPIRTTMRRTALTCVLAAALLVVPLAGPVAAADTTGHSGRGTLFTVLTGAQEVPPADPDGIGVAALTLDAGEGTICYLLAVARIDTVVAAHIHQSPKGVNGPIVVNLVAPTDGLVAACATTSRELVNDIRRHPRQYYVNVHTVIYPGGAVRGQLRH